MRTTAATANQVVTDVKHPAHRAGFPGKEEFCIPFLIPAYKEWFAGHAPDRGVRVGKSA